MSSRNCGSVGRHQYFKYIPKFIRWLIDYKRNIDARAKRKMEASYEFSANMEANINNVETEAFRQIGADQYWELQRNMLGANPDAHRALRNLMHEYFEKISDLVQDRKEWVRSEFRQLYSLLNYIEGKHEMGLRNEQQEILSEHLRVIHTQLEDQLTLLFEIERKTNFWKVIGMFYRQLFQDYPRSVQKPETVYQSWLQKTGLQNQFEHSAHFQKDIDELLALIPLLRAYNEMMQAYTPAFERQSQYTNPIHAMWRELDNILKDKNSALYKIEKKLQNDEKQFLKWKKTVQKQTQTPPRKPSQEEDAPFHLDW